MPDSEKKSSYHYPSLDGLRGIAVALVLLYHFHAPGLEGGFLGVDVFFALSGFIVTNVSLRRRRKGSSDSWQKFFLRRMRRLWLELYIVMTLTMLAASALFTLDDFRRVPESGLSQAFFAANVRFWAEAESYFDPGVLNKPLLHTWSLSVEEQFYLTYPALQHLSWAFRSTFPAGVPLFLAFVSLCFNYVPGFSESTKFFLLPFRTYQLLFGVAAATFLDGKSLHGNISPRLFDQVLCEVGAGSALVGIMVTVDQAEALAKFSPELPNILVAVATVVAVSFLAGSRGYRRKGPTVERDP